LFTIGALTSSVRDPNLAFSELDPLRRPGAAADNGGCGLLGRASRVRKKTRDSIRQFSAQLGCGGSQPSEFGVLLGCCIAPSIKLSLRKSPIFQALLDAFNEHLR